MSSRPLIDAFVRQTMVLIVQVATTAGLRVPLAHVASHHWPEAREEGGYAKRF